MKSVLVLGSGGREHALAWKLSRSPEISRIVVAPGGDAFPAEWERWPVHLSGGHAEFTRLGQRAREAGINLVVVGPDNPLADGVVDVLTDQGLLVFGPTAAAARIESSKGFAKQVMDSARVPTAAFLRVRTIGEAEGFLKTAPWPPQRGLGWVVKADGLAFGKGVVVCGKLEEGLAAARALFAVSSELVIEERLAGEEISWFGICDGERTALLEPARDFKRIGTGDQGPNTGGMGAFSPVPGLPTGMAERVRETVFMPTLRELKRRGVPFRGLLYAGLMWNAAEDRLSVIEFNARFGDPETQVLLPRLEGDLFPYLEASARGDLSGLPANVLFTQQCAVYVVGAAPGYPDAPEKGHVIEGKLLDEAAEESAQSPSRSATSPPRHFMAGVARAEGPAGPQWVTAGGRVFGSLGLGPDFETARREAYANLARIRFNGLQFRTDIGPAASVIGADVTVTASLDILPGLRGRP